MKLYIESYQTKIEDLEPLEDRVKQLEKELEKQTEKYDNLEQEFGNWKRIYKEKKTEWKVREQELRNQINKDLTKQHMLEGKIKDLEIHIKTNRTSSTSKERHKNSKIFSNKLHTNGNKNELILLKDES